MPFSAFSVRSAITALRQVGHGADAADDALGPDVGIPRCQRCPQRRCRELLLDHVGHVAHDLCVVLVLEGAHRQSSIRVMRGTPSCSGTVHSSPISRKLLFLPEQLLQRDARLLRSASRTISAGSVESVSTSTDTFAHVVRGTLYLATVTTP